MRKSRDGFALVEIVLIVVALASLGLAGWTWHQAYQAQQTAESTQATEETEAASEPSGEPENCSEVDDHKERHDCYLNDESRQILEAAIEEENPELCSDVDHVFTPHDVQSDIEEGVIGTIVEGEAAIEACERAVEQGRTPGV